MKLKDLINEYGFKNTAVLICEYLGFNDTEDLKNAKFFSQENSYSVLPFTGVTVSNNDKTWRLCRVKDDTFYSIESGYKIILEICDETGNGSHIYYQDSFLSLLEQGYIVHQTSSKQHIEHIRWCEPLCGNLNIVHEADLLVI